MIALTLGLPLLLGVLISGAGVFSRPRRRVVRRFVAIAAPVAVVPGVLLALTGPHDTLRLGWMLLGSQFAVDPIGRPLLLVGALLYGAALMSVSWIKLRDADRQYGAISAFLLVSYVGNIAVYLAADALTFYTAFALMSFSAAGLVIHYRTPAARRATTVYLVMTMVSETALLAALLLIVSHGGMMVSAAPQAGADGPALLIGFLLLVGFGVKAGTIPLHVWLPLAHPAAPPAASAVLSGAMVKAGLVGLLRFMPSGQVVPDTTETLGWTLLGLGFAGGVLAAAIGIGQSDPKVVLAYSTISQMGFISCIVAVGLLDPALAPATTAAAVVYAVHHGLAKGVLFLGVAVYQHYGRGLPRVLVVGGLVLAGLAVAGAPLTSGALGKYISKDVAESITVLGVGLDDLLAVIAVGSTLLLIRFAHLMRVSKVQPRSGVDGELISWLLIALASVSVPWFVAQRWTPVSLPAWTPYVLWSVTWPILLGVFLGLLIWWLNAHGALGRWRLRDDANVVPPGDLIVPEESMVRASARAGSALLRRGDAAWHRVGAGSLQLVTDLGRRLSFLVASAESRLQRWEASGLAILTLVFVILLAMLAVGREWIA